MQFSNIVSLLAAATTAAAVSVSYDTGYDDAGRSMGVVACSDGPEGLMMKYPKQGNLPRFPNIGGAPAVSGWGSSNCGTCWKLTYKGNSVNILAIDAAPNGFNIAKKAMDDLTNGQAAFLGRIEATVVQVDKSACGA